MSNTLSKIIFLIIIFSIFFANELIYSQQRFTLLQNNGAVEQTWVKGLTLTFDNNGNLYRKSSGWIRSISFTSIGKIYFIEKNNNAPVANAGADQIVNEGASVILGGGLSFDPDRDNLTYKWAGPSGIALSASTSQKPTFVAPEVKKDSTLVFTLVVNDGIVDSPPATVKVLVKNVLTVGINEVIDSGIGVYPNPTTGVVIISIDETISGYCDVAVYNSVGIIVNEIRAEVSNEIKIDLSDLVPGSYLLKFNIGNKLQTKMLIKQ